MERKKRFNLCVGAIRSVINMKWSLKWLGISFTILGIAGIVGSVDTQEAKLGFVSLWILSILVFMFGFILSKVDEEIEDIKRGE